MNSGTFGSYIGASHKYSLSSAIAICREVLGAIVSAIYLTAVTCCYLLSLLVKVTQDAIKQSKSRSSTSHFSGV